MGKVVSINYLQSYKGNVFITHFDPCFVLVVDVESVSSEKCPVKTGKNAFAIHSPSMLFRCCNVILKSESIFLPETYGKRFRFLMEKSNSGDIFWLSVEDIPPKTNGK